MKQNPNLRGASQFKKWDAAATGTRSNRTFAQEPNMNHLKEFSQDGSPSALRIVRSLWW